jgi:hypothetical protein
MNLKIWAGVVATVAAALVGFLSDGMTNVEWILLASIGLGAISTGVVPNLTAGMAKYAKPIVAGFLAALGLLVTLLSDGVTTSEWIMVALAWLNAVGIIPLPAPQFPATPAIVPQRGPQV